MSTLKVNSIIPVAGVPTGGGGGIIQTVQGVKTDTTSTTSTSYVDTGLSATITPSSSSSKILVKYHLGMSFRNQVFSGGCSLVRGSTHIFQGDSGAGYQATNWGWSLDSYGNYSMWNMSHEFLDSPATTSATTYKIQFASFYSGGYTVYIGRCHYSANSSNAGIMPASITLQEVSA